MAGWLAGSLGWETSWRDKKKIKERKERREIGAVSILIPNINLFIMNHSSSFGIAFYDSSHSALAKVSPTSGQALKMIAKRLWRHVWSTTCTVFDQIHIAIGSICCSTHQFRRAFSSLEWARASNSEQIRVKRVSRNNKAQMRLKRELIKFVNFTEIYGKLLSFNINCSWYSMAGSFIWVINSTNGWMLSLRVKLFILHLFICEQSWNMEPTDFIELVLDESW